MQITLQSMPRFLTPYQWRMPLALFSIFSVPLLLLSSFLGMFLTGPLLNYWRVGLWMSSLPEGYAFLFWWDTVFVVTGMILFTCVTLLMTFFFTRKHHLERRRTALLHGIILGIISITLSLLYQKTNSNVLIFLAYPTTILLITSPFLVFIESKKERVIAFFISTFFIASSIAVVQLISLFNQSNY